MAIFEFISIPFNSDRKPIISSIFDSINKSFAQSFYNHGCGQLNRARPWTPDTQWNRG